MLALTRKKGEVILIGDVRMKVVKLDADRVRLSFEAPPEVRILREELVDRQPRPVVEV